MRLLSRLLARTPSRETESSPPPALPPEEPPQGLDDELLDLLRRQVNSPIKMDLVAYFHENPYAMDAARSLAVRLGRDASLVDASAGDLVRDGVLAAEPGSRAGADAFYRLAPNEEVRRRIGRLVAFYKGGGGSQIRAAMRDISIADSVQSAIMGSARVSARDIAIRCAGGDVVLHGRVNTSTERAELDVICERLSQSRYGIRAIENRVAVEPRPSPGDPEVRAAAERALADRFHVPAPEGDASALYVHVEAIGQIIYLTGFLESPQDRGRAAQVVQSIAGVTDVVNWVDVAARRGARESSAL